ncbi:hypothetical protein TSAR_003541 [Trichomalopsis sarcophagae]|uniref:DUF4817 domain-containing protein n=1 Tax=Trichomalopsis sarcophagae TaxID=543379 RepID=A0A232FFA1_9HYME|nr:hypothetical protein TSAR_003541 [Trichomalopsis sarcophagae]
MHVGNANQGYGKYRGVYVRAAALYAERYPNRRHPTYITIRDLTNRAREGRLYRERCRHEYENDNCVLTVLAVIHLNPHISSREIERQHGVLKSTVLKILKAQRYHAYHITLIQELTLRYFAQRLQFCQWALPELFTFVMFSDEATFKNTGELNRHNCHYWSDVNPLWHRTVDNQHRWSLNVWCGIVNEYVIGPYFFNETRQRMWVQLDGEPPHFAHIERTFINERYPNQWIGRGGPVAQPPNSPDLTTPDFYLWRYLKNTCYEQQPTIREDMMECIRTAYAEIPRNVLLSTVRHFLRRIQLCIDANGRYFEHIPNG